MDQVFREIKFSLKKRHCSDNFHWILLTARFQASKTTHVRETIFLELTIRFGYLNETKKEAKWTLATKEVAVSGWTW